MTVFRICLFCSLFIVVLANLVSAEVNEVHDVFVCKEVERKISGAIKITKIARRVAYEDECEFYFYSGTDWFSVHLEKYKTEEISKKEFSDEFDFLTLAETYPTSVTQLNRRNFWEEAKGYHKRSDSDHLIMLRHKQVNITLISSSYELVLGIEPLLRTVRFGKI